MSEPATRVMLAVMRATPPALVLALVLACAALPGAARTPPRGDAVLIVIDTLRADRVEQLLARGELPFIAALRSRGAWFTDAQSASSWTPTATASIATGVYPNQHGVRRGLMAVGAADDCTLPEPLPSVDQLPTDLPTIAERLREHDYATAGVVANPNAGRALGFERGFDRFEQGADHNAAWVARRAAALQRKRRAPGQPSFLYLHFNDPHAPYRRRARFYSAATARRDGEALARYDSEIRAVDHALRGLSRRLGWNERTTIVLTADHGEAFGEHGLQGHPNHLYQELLHVPLVIAAPGVPGGEHDAPVSVVDIAPTLTRLVGLPASQAHAGCALLPAAQACSARELYAMRWSETLAPALSRKAVITRGYKLLLSEPRGHRELYDRQRDRADLHDVARKERPTALLLQETLAAFERAASRYAAPRVQPEASGELIEKLRALGYTR